MDIKTIVKSMGIRFWIPIIINDILVPLAVLLIKCVGNFDNLSQGIMTLTQMFTPFLAAFWTLVILEKYVEEEGNEIFYISDRVKLLEVLKTCLLYIVTNTFFFVWYCSFGKKFFWEWIHIVIVCFLFSASAYFFTFLVYNIALAVIPLFFYLMISIGGLNDTLSKISFYEVFGMSLRDLQNRYVYFILATIILYISGMLINKYKEKYISG